MSPSSTNYINNQRNSNVALLTSVHETHSGGNIVVSVSAVGTDMETGHPATRYWGVKEHHVVPHLQRNIIVACMNQTAECRGFESHPGQLFFFSLKRKSCPGCS